MHSRFLVSLIASAALVLASAAQAGTLTKAVWISNIQGNQLTVTNTGTTCTDTMPDVHTQRTVGSCSPGGLSPTGSATRTNYSVSLTMPLFSVKQFTTGGAIDIYTKVTLAGGQAVTGINSSAKATMGVPGMVTVKVAAHGIGGGQTSKLIAQRTTLLKLPLSVGKAGRYTDYFYVLGSIHYITVDFYAWTPDTKTFTGLTSKGRPLPDVTAMGTFKLNPRGRGTVTLVSPTKISIDGALVQRRTASFSTLKLTYAPTRPRDAAPTALLLGAGAAALVLVRSRKRS